MSREIRSWWLNGVLLLASGILGFLGNLAGGGEHHTLRFASGPNNYASATCLAVSPHSDELLLGTSYGKLHFISIADGDTRATLQENGQAAAYSADASRVLIESPDGSVLLALPSRQKLPLKEGHPRGSLGLALTPRNGKLLVGQLIPKGPAQQSGRIRQGDEVTAYGTGLLGEKTSLIGISAPEAIAALSGLPNSTVRLFVIPKGAEDEQEVVLRRSAGRGRDAAMELFEEPPPAPDNVIPMTVWGSLAFASARTGRIHAGPTAETVIADHQHALSPDFKRYAVLGPTKEDSQKASLEVFDLEKMQRLYAAPFPLASHHGLRFSPDGKFLFVASQVRVDAFDAQTGEFHHGYLLDGTRVTTIEDVKLARRKSTTFGPQAPKPRAVSMAVSPALLATADEDGNLTLWSLEQGAEVQRFPAKDQKYVERVEALEFTPDGRWLIFYRTGTLHLVEMADLTPAVDGAAKRSPDKKP